MMWWSRVNGLVLLLMLAAFTWASENDKSGGAGSDRIFVNKQGLDRLAEQASTHGWRVEREKDGSLLLFPRGDAVQAGQARDEDAVISAGDMEALEKALRASGWKTQRDADGGILLFLPAADKKSEGVAEGGDTTPERERTDQAPLTRVEPGERADSLAELKSLASKRGWRTEWDKEGNLLLFPGGEAQIGAGSEQPKKNQTSIFFAATSDCQFDRVPVVSSAGVSLPVDNWGEARKIAKLWLKIRGAENESVGRIREINNLYIVSIVLSTAPHKLRKQLVIYKPDGRMMAFP